MANQTIPALNAITGETFQMLYVDELDGTFSRSINTTGDASTDSIPVTDAATGKTIQWKIHDNLDGTHSFSATKV